MKNKTTWRCRMSGAGRCKGWIVFPVLVLLFLAGCSGDSEKRSGTSVLESEGIGEEEKLSSESGNEPSGLPSIIQHGDSRPIEPPSGTEWGRSVDAIVWGRIARLDLVTEPMVLARSGHESDLIPSCDAHVSPALEIEIDIARALRGSLDGRIRVRVGSKALDLLNPRPIRAEDGSIGWLQTGGNSGRALEEGKMIGLAVYYLEEYDLWSTMYEPMFSFHRGEQVGVERLRFQHFAAEGLEPPPLELEGLTFDQVEQIVSGEADDAAHHRRSTRKSSLLPYPAHYVAATCVPEGGEYQSEEGEETPGE